MGIRVEGTACQKYLTCLLGVFGIVYRAWKSIFLHNSKRFIKFSNQRIGMYWKILPLSTARTKFRQLFYSTFLKIRCWKSSQKCHLMLGEASIEPQKWFLRDRNAYGAIEVFKPSFFQQSEKKYKILEISELKQPVCSIFSGNNWKSTQKTLRTNTAIRKSLS